MKVLAWYTNLNNNKIQNYQHTHTLLILENYEILNIYTRMLPKKGQYQSNTSLDLHKWKLINFTRS